MLLTTLLCAALWASPGPAAAPLPQSVKPYPASYPRAEGAPRWYEAQEWREARTSLLFEAQSWNRMPPGWVHECFSFMTPHKAPAGRGEALLALRRRGFHVNLPPRPEWGDFHNLPGDTAGLDGPRLLAAEALVKSDRSWLPLAIGLKSRTNTAEGRPTEPLIILTLRRLGAELAELEERVAVAWAFALCDDVESSDVVDEWIQDPRHAPILMELLEASAVLKSAPPEAVLAEHLRGASWETWLSLAPIILTAPPDSPTLTKLCELAAEELKRASQLPESEPEAQPQSEAIEVLARAWTDQSATLLLAAFEASEPGSKTEKALVAALIRTHSPLALEGHPNKPPE